jgi:hypothetical protein
VDECVSALYDASSCSAWISRRTIQAMINWNMGSDRFPKGKIRAQQFRSVNVYAGPAKNYNLA